MGTLKQAVDRVAAAKTAIGTAITAKGGTVASGDGLEDFAADIATITNQYSAADEGKVVSNGALVSQTSTTATVNGTINTTTNNEVVVNVPNTYTAGDEGKVVSGGALVSQTAYPTTITENGTYNTTENNSVTVNVASGNSEGAVLYTDQNFTTPIDVYLIKNNNNFILCGHLTAQQNPFNPRYYYINPADMDLSAFTGKSVTAQGYNASGYQITLNGSIYGMPNAIQLTANNSTSNYRFYGITTIT